MQLTKFVRKPKLPNKDILPPAVTETSEGLEDLTKLKEHFETVLSDRQLKAVKGIAYKIGKVGMTLDEACLLAYITRDEFMQWCEEHPQLATYMKIQALEFKFSLMEIATKQARDNKDVKIATWLLEKMFSDFDSSLKKEAMKFNRNNEEDVVAMAFAVVRRGNVEQMPVKASAGEAVLQKDTKDEIMALKDSLAVPDTVKIHDVVVSQVSQSPISPNAFENGN